MDNRVWTEKKGKKCADFEDYFDQSADCFGVDISKVDEGLKQDPRYFKGLW